MSLPALVVANFFIRKALESGCKDLTAMKLQKLIYYAHGWHLAFRDKSLINEHVEAWQYGPVVPSVYHEFKILGNSNITQLTSIDDDDFDEQELADSTPLLEKIWSVYSNYTGVQLSNATHAEGTPWHQTWVLDKGSDYKNTDIPETKITAFFKKRITSK